MSLSSAAVSVVWRDDITDAQVLAFGATSPFSGVGTITIGSGFGVGSGWVLTANHVLTTGRTGTFVLPGLGSWTIAGAYRFAGPGVSVGRLTGFTTTGLFTPTLNLTPYRPNQPVVSTGFGLSPTQSSDTYNDDGKRRGLYTVSLGISYFSSSSTGRATPSRIGSTRRAIQARC